MHSLRHEFREISDDSIVLSPKKEETETPKIVNGDKVIINVEAVKEVYKQFELNPLPKNWAEWPCEINSLVGCVGVVRRIYKKTENIAKIEFNPIWKNKKLSVWVPLKALHPLNAVEKFSRAKSKEKLDTVLRMYLVNSIASSSAKIISLFSRHKIASALQLSSLKLSSKFALFDDVFNGKFVLLQMAKTYLRFFSSFRNPFASFPSETLIYEQFIDGFL